MHDEVVAAVSGAPRTVAAAGTAIRVEVAAAKEAASAPEVPAVVATAAVADLIAVVGDATGGATSGRSAPQKRVTSSPNVLSARVLATRRAHAHRTRRCWRLSCRCNKENLAVEAQAFVAKETAHTYADDKDGVTLKRKGGTYISP